MTDLRAIAISNEALSLVGHPAIHDFEGKTPASEVAARLYNLTLGSLLDAYDWRFAMRQAQLTQLPTKPVNKFEYQHALPLDRDGEPARLYSDKHGTVVVDSAIYEDTVHTYCSVLYCDYVKKGSMTGVFRNLFVRALAADFATSLCDDRGMRDRFYSESFGTPREGGRGGLFKAAMSNDAKGAEPRSVLKMGTGPLIDAHMGHGGRSAWLSRQ